MAVSFIGVGTDAESANSPITPGLPARQTGDLLVAVVGLRSRTATVSVTSGSGWTQRLDHASGWASGANRITVFTRTASGNSGDGVTFTPSGGDATVDVIGHIFSVRGANNDNPIAGSAGSYGTANNEDIPTPPLTVAPAGSMAVVVGSKANDSGASPEILTPSGWSVVRINDSTLGDDLLLGTFYRVTTGGNETMSAGTLDVQTPSSAASWAALTFAVAPAAGEIIGALGATLAAAAATAAGKAALIGSGGGAPGAASTAALAHAQTHGALSFTPAAASCASAGANRVAAVSSGLPGAVTATGAGKAAVSAFAVVGLSAAADVGSGDAAILAQAAVRLHRATVSASGGANHLPITSNVTAALVAAAVAAAGRATIAGSLDSGMIAAQAHSAGNARVGAALVVGLTPADAQAHSRARSAGAAAAALTPSLLHVLSVSALRGTAEQLPQLPAAAALAGVGRAIVRGAGGALLVSVGLDATGRALLAGAFDLPALDPAVLDGSALARIAATAAQSFAPGTVQAWGAVAHPANAAALAATLRSAQALGAGAARLYGAAAPIMAGTSAHGAGSVMIAGRASVSLTASAVQANGVLLLIALVYGAARGPGRQSAATGPGIAGTVTGPGA